MWTFTTSVPDDEIDQQLDNMILRTLRGEAIPFDEWEDIKAQVEEELEKKIDQWNEAPEGMTLEEARTLAEADRETFRKSLERFGLPLESRYHLCEGLCEQAKKQPSPELLRVFCDIASDNDYLLDVDHKRFSEEEYIQRWASCKEDADELYELLSERAKQPERYKKLLADAKSNRSAKIKYTPESLNELEQIFQMYIELYEVREDKTNRARLMDNIAYLLQLANNSKALTVWKPLFLYQAMSQHKKRLLKAVDLHIDVSALWDYQTYKIERNNGKNYNAYRKQLELFRRLCDIVGGGKGVDLPLCLYGFEHLSNLGEFYWMDDESESEIPFSPTIEDLLDYSSFFCFEQDDNILLRESHYSHKQFERLIRNMDRRQEKDKLRALGRIETYMNQNVVELTNQFLEANQAPEQVKKLCRDILEASGLSAKQQPKSSEETEVFLIAINGGLIDAVNGFADLFLAQAGWALIGEPERSE